jgi:hypothetical protein
MQCLLARERRSRILRLDAVVTEGGAKILDDVQTKTVFETSGRMVD